MNQDLLQILRDLRAEVKASPCHTAQRHAQIMDLFHKYGMDMVVQCAAQVYEESAT